MGDVSRFAIGAAHRSRVTAVLKGAGVVWRPSHPCSVTVLDTFDGRLAASRLRLTMVHDTERSVHLSGRRVAWAPLVHLDVPGRAEQLPEGALRTVASKVAGERALSAQAVVTVRRRVGESASADGASACSVVRCTSVRIDGVAVPSVDVLEVHLRRGSRRAGRELSARLVAAGAVAIEGDVVDLAANAAGRSLAGFDTSPRTPLDPTMSSSDGLRSVLADLARTLAATWDGVADHTDVEYLHDFRVALRRTRSIVWAGRHLFSDPQIDVARDRLGALAALTSRARDLDVYLLEWSHYLRGLEAETIEHLQPLLDLLRDQADQEHRRLGAVLRLPETRAILDDWQRWLHAPHDRPGDAGHVPLDATVAQLLLRGHRVLVQRGRAITPESPADQLHSLRKDAKRLRYLLECFGTLLPAEPRVRFVKRLKAVQDNLGAHQDADVHVAQLAQFAHELHERGASADTLLAVGRLSERMHQARATTRQAFSARFADYDTKATTKALNDLVDAVR